MFIRNFLGTYKLYITLDIVAILEVLGSVVLGGGLLEFVKWLYNRKTDKKAAEQKIKQDAENSTIDN